MHLFPNSQLEEVGLCWVNPKTQIPSDWGIQTEDLPPMGASPDGLIRHRVSSPRLPSPAQSSAPQQPTAASPAAPATPTSTSELESLLTKLNVSYTGKLAVSSTGGGPSSATNRATSAMVSNVVGHQAHSELNQQEWLEAVEVKNVCPFKENGFVVNWRKRKHHPRPVYSLSDPGPYSQVGLSLHVGDFSCHYFNSLLLCILTDIVCR